MSLVGGEFYPSGHSVLNDHTLRIPGPDILRSYKVTAIFRWGTGKRFLSYFQVKTVIGNPLHLETLMLVGRRKAYGWKSWRGRGGRETGRKSPGGRGLKCCCRVNIMIKWLYCMWCYHYVYHEVSGHDTFWCQELDSDFNVYMAHGSRWYTPDSM
jgi:hypothetical protein